MIVGTDGLNMFGAMIDCEGQQVVVRTPSGGELVIFGEGTRIRSAFCSAASAQKYIQHGYMGYLAYVVDTRARKLVSVSDTPVVREFLDVFPEELPSMHPERRVEFMIDLVPGAAPIAKASYHLAPPEVLDLSYQLQELFDKQFIRPSSSL